MQELEFFYILVILEYGLHVMRDQRALIAPSFVMASGTVPAMMLMKQMCYAQVVRVMSFLLIETNNYVNACSVKIQIVILKMESKGGVLIHNSEGLTDPQIR